ncbi:MAG: CopD family protein [Rhodanobacter sp.]
MLIAAAAMALTRSQTGHPADHGDFALSVWIDWLHLLAAGIWVGSMFGMSLAVFPGLVRAGEHAVPGAAAMFRRLSTLSGGALAVLLACGIFNAVRQLGHVDALWTTHYGTTLDVKLLIVLAMIVMGAHNRYVKLPRLLRFGGQAASASLFGDAFRRIADPAEKAPSGAVAVRQCARAVLVESVLGLAVIVTTSVLLHAMPPADRPRQGMDGRMGLDVELVSPAGRSWLRQAAAVHLLSNQAVNDEGRMAQASVDALDDSEGRGAGCAG